MIERLLTRLARALAFHRIPYMLIGGQAVLFYGSPRLTQDVDVTLGVDVEASETILAVCRRARLRPLIGNPRAFVRKTHVLPAADPASGLRVDLIFANTPYEHQAIKRARRMRLGGVAVPVAAFEDLVIHKLVAGRPIDVEDVRRLLTIRSGRTDVAYIQRWLKRFADLHVLDADPLATFDRLRRTRRHSR